MDFIRGFALLKKELQFSTFRRVISMAFASTTVKSEIPTENDIMALINYLGL